MRPEESRHEFPRPLRVQLRDCFQTFDLVGGRQAVTTLDLDGGDAKSQQAPQARTGEVFQFFFRRLPHTADGAENAATACSDLLITHPLQTLLEFIHARTGEEQMRVTIDETR